ncbi:MAG: hypothetical protein HKN48_09090 [Flavobacteriaceae bacterium]|nr:hypothetical protein [Flavobacteriaceae bacterium]
MSRTRKFRTKNGFCHVMPDRIVFTHSGFYGRMGDIAGNGRMVRLLVLFGAFTLTAFFFAYLNFLKDQWFWAILFSVIGGYLFYGILNNLNNTIHPIILREAIREVKYVKSNSVFGYPFFEVRFKNAKGKIKRRLITLPRANGKNANDIREAVQLMAKEGLID